LRLQVGVWCRFWFGLAAGLVGLCVAIEIVRVIYRRGWVEAFFAVVEYVGQFTWLIQFQTLLTGMAAVAAAAFSVRAVRDQIAADERGVQRQLEFAAAVEADGRQSRYEAALAVLPLSISLVMDVLRERASALRRCIDLCRGPTLPHRVALPAFPPFPSNVVSDLKEAIELAAPDSRQAYRRLLVAMQVQDARLTALSQYDKNPELTIVRANLLAYVLGEAEVSARALQIYLAARKNDSRPLSNISKREAMSAMFQIGIYDELRDELVRTFDLNSDGDYPIFD